jgi:hypothetical protein
MTTKEIADLTRLGLDMIAQIATLLTSAQNGAITPEQANDSIRQLHDRLTADRVEMDKRIADKFDKSEP